MGYDSGFDQRRLDQLASTYLSDSLAVGDVVFFADDDGRLGKATWCLDKGHYKSLNDSGFKYHLMELLDSFLVYRAQYEQPNATQGVVKLNKEKLRMEWITPEEASRLAE
ncbi:hypothetical protein LG302_12585 [Halomonas organivorans]